MDRIFQYQAWAIPLMDMVTPPEVSMAWVFVPAQRVIPSPPINLSVSVEPIFVPIPYDPATMVWDFHQGQRVLPRYFRQPAADGPTIVIRPTSLIIGCPTIEFIINLTPRTTAKPNMPIAYITQTYRYSTSPDSCTTGQSPGTQPQFNPS